MCMKWQGSIKPSQTINKNDWLPDSAIVLISPFPHLFIKLGGTDAYMQEPEYAGFHRGRLVPSHGRRFTLVCLLRSKRDYGDAGEWRQEDHQSTTAKLIWFGVHIPTQYGLLILNLMKQEDGSPQPLIKSCCKCWLIPGFSSSELVMRLSAVQGPQGPEGPGLIDSLRNKCF